MLRYFLIALLISTFSTSSYVHASYWHRYDTNYVNGETLRLRINRILYNKEFDIESIAYYRDPKTSEQSIFYIQRDQDYRYYYLRLMEMTKEQDLYRATIYRKDIYGNRWERIEPSKWEYVGNASKDLAVATMQLNVMEWQKTRIRNNDYLMIDEPLDPDDIEFNEDVFR